MIKITNNGIELTIKDKCELKVCEETSDGVYFKFEGGSEYILYCNDKTKNKAIGTMLMRATAENIEVNFNHGEELIRLS